MPTVHHAVVIALGFAIAVGLTAPGGAETRRLTASRDVWVSAYPGEDNTSMGKTPELKLKSNMEVALLDFDAASLRGKRITSAELWMHNVPESVEEEMKRLGIANRPDCLRKIGLSTIGQQWEEGEQDKTYQADPAGHGATYNEASYGRRTWAYPGSKLWDVIMGNGNSLHCHGERQYQGNGWWKVAVEPRLIAAMVAGLSHGLVLEEESGGGALAANNYVHSRESGAYAPYLAVTFEDSPGQTPDAPRGLRVGSASEFATLSRGAARIRLAVPKDAFGYQVTVNGAPIPAWQVPYAVGTEQSFVLENLPGAEELRVEVRALNEAGLASPPASAAGRASNALVTPPPLPAPPFRPVPGTGASLTGAVKVWAYPEVTKVDPISGEAMFEPARDLRRANPIWDGGRGLVRVAAARGEIAAFQVAVEADAPLKNIRLDMTDLVGEQGVVSKQAVRLFRVWYVSAGGKWQPEYAIPLTRPLEIPAPDNAIVGQRLQAVYIDIAVPQTAAAGTYRGRIAVTLPDAKPIPVEVELVVYPASIPDTLSFNAELNSYEPPGGTVGSDYFYAAHRLAHYHRCTINTVPYSQSGKMTTGYAPLLTGEGEHVHVSDWSEFDRLIGPLLNGSAFASNPRAGIPVKSFYLPLSEHWPLSLWEYYPFHGSPKEESVMLRHMLEAPPIEQAFSASYRSGFVNVTRDFIGHAEERGWTATDFQMYLNDKYDWGGTWWTLDEPAGRDDWQALRFWAGLFKEGKAGARHTHFYFRGDVSRPWWQYDQLDGLMDTIYYNNEIFDLPNFARVYSRRIPDPHVYGTCNDVSASDHESALWCLKAYALGLSGVLPWQSLGPAESLMKPETTALIVPGNVAGYDGPVASLRIFALRRGAQDVELLRLLAEKEQYSTDQIAALIEQKVDLGSQFKQQFPEEAAGLTFGEASAQAFAELKEGVLIRLSQ